MIYLLGVIGLAQALILPGLCMTASLKSLNALQRIIFALPLSLLLNYYLVWGLVALGIYQTSLMFAVLAIEVAYLIYSTKSRPSETVFYPPLEKISEISFLLCSLFALTKYSQAWVRSFGEPFLLWDAVFSWNEWGRNWFEGSFATSDLYPNGLPIAFSIPYIFMGTPEIESFSKSAMGIFYLFGIGALIELGFRRKDLRSVAWLCAFIFPTLQSRFLQSHWNSGYADVPLALTLLFAFCASFLNGKDAPWVFGLIAGTAPLVKQPGLLFAALSPLLIRGWSGFRKNFWQVAPSVAVASVPWYIFITAMVLEGKSANNTSYLANLVPGGFWDRWKYTISLLDHFASPMFLLSCILFSAIGTIVSKEARRWWLFLGLPYFLIWGTLFAYDIRNLSMSLFPLALAISAGAAFLFQQLEQRLTLRFRLSLPLSARSPAVLGRAVIILTFIFALAAMYKPISRWIKHGSLLAWEKEQRLYMGDTPKGNAVFVSLANCQPDAGWSLLTNYWWAKVIPPLKKRVKSVECDRIKNGIAKGEKGYVFLYVPTCDVGTLPTKIIYEEPAFKIFAMNPSMPTECGSASPEIP